MDKINFDQQLKYDWLLDKGRIGLLEFIEQKDKYKINILIFLKYKL